MPVRHLHATQWCTVQPTIVDNVARDCKLFVEEIFGPVLSVTSFETIEEAVELASDTVYGLAASA